MGRSIGITGGIGAGKSVVSRLLRLRGYPVFDCDTEARRLMEDDDELKRSLTRLLGNEAYSDGRLNREYVAAKIFPDHALRSEVNRLVHASVREAYSVFMKKREGSVFIESAILATGGLIPMVDEIWLVDAPKPVRRKRVAQRNGLSEDSIEARMVAQEREFDSLPKERTHIIDNDGEASLWSQVKGLLQNDGWDEPRGSDNEIDFEKNNNSILTIL